MANTVGSSLPEGFVLEDQRPQIAPRPFREAPVTYYSLGKDVGGSDETQDSNTNKGLTSKGKNLTPGIAAVNDTAIPLGTILRDLDTSEVYLASDRHGNDDPNVIDIYEPPARYKPRKDQRRFEEVGFLDTIPTTVSGVREALAGYGKVPDGESADEWLNGGAIAVPSPIGNTLPPGFVLEKSLPSQTQNPAQKVDKSILPEGFVLVSTLPKPEQSAAPSISSASNPNPSGSNVLLDRAILGFSRLAPQSGALASDLLGLVARAPETMAGIVDYATGGERKIVERFRASNFIAKFFQDQAKANRSRDKELADASAALGGGIAGQAAEAVPLAAMQAIQDIALSGGSAAVPRALVAAEPGLWKSIARGFTESTPLRGSATAGGARSGLSTLGEASDEYEKQGLSPEQAQNKALPEAALSGLSTFVVTTLGGYSGAERVLKEEGAKGLRKKIFEILHSIPEEAVEEASDQALQDQIDRFHRNPQKSISDTLKEIAWAGSLGGVMGGAVSTIGAVATPTAPKETNLLPSPKRSTETPAEGVPPAISPETEFAPAPTNPVTPTNQTAPAESEVSIEEDPDQAELDQLTQKELDDLLSAEPDESASLLEDDAPEVDPETDRMRQVLEGDQPEAESEFAPQSTETKEAVAKLASDLRMRASLAEEGGFLDASVFNDVADFGRRVYAKGMDFAKWSGEMIRHLGQGIQTALKAIWKAMNQGVVGGGAINSQSGSVLVPSEFAKQAEQITKPLNKKPDAKVEIYERAKAKLTSVLEKVNNQTEEIRTLGTDTSRMDETAERRLLRTEQDLAERLATLDEEERAKIEQAGQDNLAKFMDRIEVAKTPEARAALRKAAKEAASRETKAIRTQYAERRRTAEARATAARKGAITERNVRVEMTDKTALQRSQMLGSLATLDAITSVLPPSVRGKIGGMTKLAGMKTDAARAQYIEDRVKKISKELDASLTGEYIERIEKLLDKAQPKKGENRVSRSRIGPQAQKDVSFISEVAELNADELSKRLLAIEAELNAASDPADIVEIMNRWALADRFGNLVERSPEELASAWKVLADTVRGGREKWKVQEEARVGESKAKAERALKELGRPYGAMSNELRTSEEKDSGFRRKVRDFTEGLLAWYQDLQEAFGTHSQTATEFEKSVRLSTNKYEDAAIAIRKRFRQDMRKALGVNSEIALHKKLQKLTQARDTDVQFLEGRDVKTMRIPIDRAKDAIEGRAQAYGFNRDDLFELTKLLDDVKDNPRKKTLIYERVVHEGKPTDQRMSELEAIQYILSWGQADVRARMEKQGINAQAIKGLEKFISPDGHKVKDWLKERYSEEYTRMNEIYRRMFGMDMPKVDNYAPTFYEVSAADKSQAGPAGDIGSQSGMTPGFVKSRVNHNELISSVNALDAYFRHAIQSEYWMAFAETNRDARAVIGNRKVLRTVRAVYGGAMEERLKKWLTALEKNGLKDSESYSKSGKFLNSLLGPNAVVALGGKIGVLMKQASAVAGSLMEIPAHEAARSLGRLVSGRLSTSLHETWKSPTIQRRIEGGVSPAVRAVMQRGGINPGALLVLMEKGMAPISLTDAAFTTFSAAVAYDYHYRKARAAGMDERGAKIVASDKMDETVRRTAQPASVADRSIVEASTNPFLKATMMFMSEARQKFAISYLAAKRLTRGEDWAMNVQKLAVSWVLLGLITQVMGDLYRDWFTDAEDDEVWQPEDYARAMILGQMNGLFMAGGFISDLTTWLTGGHVFPDSQSPLGDAMTAIQSKKINPANWEDSEDVMKGMKLILGTIARVSGQTALAVPAMIANTLKDAQGLAKNLKFHKAVEIFGGKDLGFVKEANALDDLAVLRNAAKKYAETRGKDAKGVSKERREFQVALMLGDRERASAYLKNRELKFKGDPLAQKLILQDAKETARALRPARIGAGSATEVDNFFRWAAKTLPAEEMATIRKIDRTYQSTAQSLGLSD